MKNAEWALDRLLQFIAGENYGEVTFTVQKGEVVNVKTVKSEKPPIDNKT